MILKPNMVISGKKCPVQAAPEQVAAATVRCSSAHVPGAVPGIAFLSGGQRPAEASAAPVADESRSGRCPGSCRFSYGRALQDAALERLGGQEPPTSPPVRRSSASGRASMAWRAPARFRPSMEQQAA